MGTLRGDMGSPRGDVGIMAELVMVAAPGAIAIVPITDPPAVVPTAVDTGTVTTAPARIFACGEMDLGL